MTSLQIGPLAFPVVPLLWLAGLWLALFAVRRLVRRTGRAATVRVDREAARDGHEAAAERSINQTAGQAAGQAADQAETTSAAEHSLWLAALAGFGTARLVFVIGAWDAYRSTPLSLLDIRDGGWALLPGLAAAALVLGWRGWQAPRLRQPLAAAAVLVLAVWGGGGLALGVHRQPELPALLLQPVAVPSGQAAVVLGPTTLDTLVRGRPAVVNLWATWCAPCRVELPLLAEAAAAHPKVRFLFVNQGERAGQVRHFLATQPFRLDQGSGGVWLDKASALGPAIGSGGLPTTLFIDAQGRIVGRHMGVLNAAALRARLAELE